MIKKSIKKHFRQILALSLGLIFMGLISSNVQALAQGVVQGYFSDDTSLKPGMVVQLSDNSTADEPKVERATDESIGKIIGLAIKSGDSFAVIASSKQEIFVQTSSEAKAYVTNLGGEIKKGDLLTISPLKGILMRTENSGTAIFGTALEDFPTATAEKFPIDGGTGTQNEALVAQITINLDQRSFADGQSTSNSVLARIGQSIAGKSVGEVRVLIALIIFLIVLVAEGGIIYGAISSAITAMGRNPLASKEIRKELAKVLLIAFGVLAVGLAAIYGILWV
jgi:hypothetical protein